MRQLTVVASVGLAATGRTQRVLVVDDEVDILQSLKGLLELAIRGVQVTIAANGAEALRVLANERVDLIMTDYRMPGMDGLELLEAARSRGFACPRILLTAFPEAAMAEMGLARVGLDNFFTKPVDPDRLLAAVRRALARPASS